MVSGSGVVHIGSAGAFHEGHALLFGRKFFSSGVRTIPTRSVGFIPQWSHACVRICSCVLATLRVGSESHSEFTHESVVMPVRISICVHESCLNLLSRLVVMVNAIGGARLPLDARVHIVLYVSCVCQVTSLMGSS